AAHPADREDPQHAASFRLQVTTARAGAARQARADVHVDAVGEPGEGLSRLATGNDPERLHPVEGDSPALGRGDSSGRTDSVTRTRSSSGMVPLPLTVNRMSFSTRSTPPAAPA